MCFQGECVAAPSGYGTGGADDARLSASSTLLDFGAVAAQGEKRLGLTLSNVGEAMIELTRVQIEPVNAAFRIESMGSGPFWIRQGRGRDVFVTYKPALGGVTQATLVISSQAPELRIALRGN